MSEAAETIVPGPESPPMQIVDPLAERRADVDAKQAGIAEVLREAGRDWALLLEPENVSWLTSGAASSGILSPDELPALLLTPEQRWLVCSNVDSQRLFDEELDGLGFQLKEWSWHWDRTQYVTELVQGKPFACDRPLADGRLVADALRRLRRVLSPHEQACLRSLGQALGHALEATGRTLARGQTEEQVAGQLGHRLLHHGVRPVSLGVAADGRSRRYRRAGYTARPVQFYCTLTATAERYGLFATATRAVCFGAPSPELLHEFESVAKVTAAYAATARPKSLVRDVLAAGRRVYAMTGFEHEWHCAPQGQLTGRSPVELLFTPSSLEQLAAGCAAAWNASVGAAASGDTFLVTDDGPELVTSTEQWPVKGIRVQGTEVVRPFLLVRELTPA